MNNGSSEHRLIVYAILEEQIEGIQHYDKLQFIWRKISLTNLMSAFAGIGFLLTINPQQLPFSSLTISIVICLSALFINLIISSIDLIFIERLLISTFTDALRLEKENSWLFPIHSHMMNSAREYHGSISKKIQFYIGCGKDLLYLLFVIIAFLNGLSKWHFTLFVALIIMFCIWGYGNLLRYAARQSEKKLYKIFKNELGDISIDE
jgi:hypothetical protein